MKNDPVVGRMKVSTLIETMPGYGKAKAEKIMKELQIAESLSLIHIYQVIYIIEANPRASRTVPFVSKATGVPLAKMAARIMSLMSCARFEARAHSRKRSLSVLSSSTSILGSMILIELSLIHI